MNLRLSYNWLKEYVKTNKSVEEFAKLLSLAGPSVDRIIKAGGDFAKVVVGQIKEIKPHPNADKLQVCQVDIGKEVLIIVCGAPNIAVGQKVPVVLVGGRVGEMEIKQAKIRGRESFGMMCSQKELGLGEDHSGIYILPDEVKVGLPLEKALPLGDEILEVEITANRPDAMGAVGLAREAAAILKEKFLFVESQPNLKITKAIALSVDNKEPKLCPRYQAIVMTDVKVEASPLWLQQRLLASGLRPINNLVDITNYILLELGQPMHVFDYEKLADSEIKIRLAKKGEKILALDGKKYELNDNNLVIADAKAPVAIAGVMGGELSAVSEQTKTIVFEAANFVPVSVRKTARALNLHSESSDLFEKGLAPQGTEGALLRAIELAQELAGAKAASKVFDLKNYSTEKKEIILSAAKVRAVLGQAIKLEKIKESLISLGFAVKEKGSDKLAVVAPWWREKDIAEDYDLIEEVARLFGYYNLAANLPSGEIPVDFTAKSEFVWEDRVKDILSGFGLTEVYNYSFVSETLLNNCYCKPEAVVRIANPLSLDFELMRPSLLPGLLQNAAENQGLFPTIDIFELSKVYLNQRDDLPQEKNQLVLLALDKDESVAFLRAKGYLLALLIKLNLADEPALAEVKADGLWQKGKTLAIKIKQTNIGVLGLASSEVLSNFGLKKAAALVEIDWEKLMILAKESAAYEPIPKFPGLELDLSMEIKEEILYQKVVALVKNIDPLIKDVAFLSIFQGEKIPRGQKALAIRIFYQAADRTLKLTEAQEVQEQVVAGLKKKYNIKVR